MSVREEASLQSCQDAQATDIQEGTPSSEIQGITPDHTDEQDPNLVIPLSEAPIDEEEILDEDDDDFIPKGLGGPPTAGPPTNPKPKPKVTTSTKTQDAKKPTIERPPTSTPPPKTK